MASIHDLPSEVVQNIAMCLPYASDALALSQASRQLYHLLSPSNAYFWYQRRRTYLESRVNSTMAGVVKRDHSEPFDAKQDYRQLVVDARRGELGNNKIQRCQICCFQRAHKIWEEWKQWICPSCFDLVAIDKPRITFLKLALSGLRCQKKRRGQAIRYCYWRADIEKACFAKFGKTLKEKLQERANEVETKARFEKDYRDRHSKVCAEVCKELLKTPEYSPYTHFLAPEFVKELCNDAAENTKHLIEIRKKDRPRDWMENFCKTNLLPTDKYNNGSFYWGSSNSMFCSWKVINKVREVHYRRFGYVPEPNNPDGWMDPKYVECNMSADYKELCGVCPFCYAQPYKKPGENYNKQFNYMTREQLVSHVVGCHFGESLRTEFDFLESVEGREPVMLGKLERRPTVDVPNRWGDIEHT